jgi:transcriptional regulator with XRE-family HTH domain
MIDEVRFNRELAAQLRRRRSELCVSQGRLAMRVGITHDKIGLYERGLQPIRSARMLVSLAEALDCSAGVWLRDAAIAVGLS